MNGSADFDLRESGLAPSGPERVAQGGQQGVVLGPDGIGAGRGFVVEQKGWGEDAVFGGVISLCCLPAGVRGLVGARGAHRARGVDGGLMVYFRLMFATCQEEFKTGKSRDREGRV